MQREEDLNNSTSNVPLAENLPEESEIKDEESQHSSEGEGDDAMQDSSEEDDEEDDEEAIQKVREGFIVDDDEEDEGISHKKKRKHKRKAKTTIDDALDEDDLELLMENSGHRPTSSESGQFKRLKRAQESEESDVPSSKKGRLDDFFSDDDDNEQEGDNDEDNQQQNERRVPDERNILDEFEDFIEDDEFSDEDEAKREKAKRERQRISKGPRLDTSKLSSVDRESLQQLFEVFGNGAEYEWALDAQEIEDEGNAENLEPTALEEVFEHAELKERMLTEEDNLIRIIDIPERYQKYRNNLNYIDLNDNELENEKLWIGDLLYLEKSSKIRPDLIPQFKEAVGKAVEFISKENYEVPFIWTHRRDFLLYAEQIEDANGTNEIVHRLLDEDDLWRIIKLDIEYHSLYEKRLNVEKLVEELNVVDDLLKDFSSLDSIVAIQDLQDYIHFTYSKEIRDLASKKQPEEANELARLVKKNSKFSIYERIKENVLYDAVEAYGITAKQFGENVQDQSSKNFQASFRIHATDDPFESPNEIIEKLIDDEEVLFKDYKNAQGAVRKFYSESIFHNPKIRQEVRNTFKNFALISVAITEKGRSVIDNHSNYADIKYAINRTPGDLVRNPDILLRMLEAESQGLLVIKISTKDYEKWFESIFACLKSDGLSDISEKWNKEREFVLRMSFAKLTTMIGLNTKEDLRSECQRLLANDLRKKFLNKIDQAPFTPFGYDKGTKPTVLALSFGKGDRDNAVVGTYVKDNGKVSEFFKSDHNPITDRESEDLFQGQLKAFIDKSLNGKSPDVIVVSGYNAHTRRLFDIINSFVQMYRIQVDVDDVKTQEPPLVKVIYGPDETARLYQNSQRAKIEFSDKATLVKYCIGLAHYVQNPIVEYIALGDDILSLTFSEFQKLLPNDLILETFETCFVDIVNMLGVEINEAVRDENIGKLLPFVSGLGPRKASGLIRNINSKLGSSLATRSELIEHELSTANIFLNCSSFLYIPYDENISANDGSVELLDATRIHPEDYDLARKMAADALDLDEEDIGSIEEQGGIIYQLMQDGVNKVDDLNLNAYGKELETKFGKKKYATLQSIKEELVNNYEELRRSFHILDVQETFEMLSGESTKSFTRNTIVPVTVTRVGRNLNDLNNHSTIKYLKVTTSSLIQGNIEESLIPRNATIIQGQVLQAVVLDVQYEQFSATFSIMEQDIKRALQPKIHKDNSKWDLEAEENDRQKEIFKEKEANAKSRNFQHPLFHNFNHKQAEEFLAPKSLGDCVLRPSSKGPEFLTVTWKVATNLFQHLIIEEKLIGRRKKFLVEGKSYDDLDELIVQHVQVIAAKVREMVRHPKFREGALTEVQEWLHSYTKANPKTSAYIFCYDHRAPGWFLLLFKVNVNTPISTWHVKTGVDGYQLKGFDYPNMLRLCNGFKQLYKTQTRKAADSARNGGQQVNNMAYSNYGY